MPRVIDHAVYKEEILAKCFDLFARRGYGNLTMRALARELDLSTGSLYHYFPSKEAIFEEMVTWLSGRDVQRVLAQIPVESPAAERLRIILQFVALQEADFLNLLLLVLDYRRARPADGERAVGRVLDIYKTAIREQLAAAGAEAQAAAVGDFLFNGLLGLVAGRYLDPAIDFRQQCELLAASLLALMPGGPADAAGEETRT